VVHLTYPNGFFCQAPPEPSAPKQKGRRLLASEASVLSANAGHPLTGEPSTGSKKRGLKQDMMPMMTAGKVVGNGRIAVGGGSIARVVNPRFDPYGQSFNPVASVTLTVADPRQPTADLTLELPRWVSDRGSVPVVGRRPLGIACRLSSDDWVPFGDLSPWVPFGDLSPLIAHGRLILRSNLHSCTNAGKARHLDSD